MKTNVVHKTGNILLAGFMTSGICFFALLFLTSCSVPVIDKLNPDVVYKRDMSVTVDGVTSEGVLVVPYKDSHKFHIVAQGDLDLFTFTTCHREEVAEDASNVSETRGLFKRKIEKKREIKLDYKPTLIENTGACPVQLGGYEQKGGRHSWGFVDFESPSAKLQAKVYCNGQEIKANGVSVCQSRMGLLQAIEFEEEVYVAPTKECDFGIEKAKFFKFPIKKGQCVYAFMTKTFEIHRLTTLGYELVPIRK